MEAPLQLSYSEPSNTLPARVDSKKYNFWIELRETIFSQEPLNMTTFAVCCLSIFTVRW